MCMDYLVACVSWSDGRVCLYWLSDTICFCLNLACRVCGAIRFSLKFAVSSVRDERRGAGWDAEVHSFPSRACWWGSTDCFHWPHTDTVDDVEEHHVVCAVGVCRHHRVALILGSIFGSSQEAACVQFLRVLRWVVTIMTWSIIATVTVSCGEWMSSCQTITNDILLLYFLVRVDWSSSTWRFFVFIIYQ